MSEHRAAPQEQSADIERVREVAHAFREGYRAGYSDGDCGEAEDAEIAWDRSAASALLTKPSPAAPQEGETPGARGKCPTCGSAVTITHAKIGEPVYEPADSAARPQGWQPISTAPKDGTAILVFQRSSMRVCSWSPGGWAFYQRREGAPIVVMTQATHWMPLPAPPEAREDEKP